MEPKKNQDTSFEEASHFHLALKTLRTKSGLKSQLGFKLILKPSVLLPVIPKYRKWLEFESLHYQWELRREKTEHQHARKIIGLRILPI